MDGEAREEGSGQEGGRSGPVGQQGRRGGRPGITEKAERGPYLAELALSHRDHAHSRSLSGLRASSPATRGGTAMPGGRGGSRCPFSSPAPPLLFISLAGPWALGRLPDGLGCPAPPSDSLSHIGPICVPSPPPRACSQLPEPRACPSASLHLGSTGSDLLPLGADVPCPCCPLCSLPAASASTAPGPLGAPPPMSWPPPGPPARPSVPPAASLTLYCPWGGLLTSILGRERARPCQAGSRRSLTLLQTDRLRHATAWPQRCRAGCPRAGYFWNVGLARFSMRRGQCQLLSGWLAAAGSDPPSAWQPVGRPAHAGPPAGTTEATCPGAG